VKSIDTHGATKGAGRFIGASVKRREDPRLLTGHGTYVDDVVVPGMLHAAFVRSPYAKARILTIDVEAARRLPGVVAVWTADDINDDVTNMPLSIQTGSGALVADMHPLAKDDVRYVGDPVVIVVATSRYIAEDGCDLVEVDYEPLTPVVDYESAAESTHLVHDELGTNLSWQGATEPDPELDAAFAASAMVVERTFHQQRQANVPMETRGLIAQWDPASEELTIWISTQNPHEVRLYYSAIMGVPEHRIRVIMRDVGGGFGAKFFVARDEVSVVIAARRLRRPVKWIEDRRENLIASNHAREEKLTVRMGVDKGGLITAVYIDYMDCLGAYPLNPPEISCFLATAMFPGPYRVPKYGYRAQTVFTNTCARGAYRGPWMMETVARESMMDIVARELGLDPLEFRRRNVIASDELPFTTASGLVYENISPAETLEQAAEIGQYQQFREAQAEARAAGRLVGIGVSLYVEPTAIGVGAQGVEVANIRIEPTGKVNVLMGTASHGHSLETTMVQVVAEHLGVALDDVILRQGDTAVSPYGGGTGGSRSAVVGGGVARIASMRLADRVRTIAGHLMEASPEDLVIEDSVVSVRGTPSKQMTFQEIAQTAYLNSAELPAGIDPGLEETARYAAPMFTFSNAAHLCVVEVNPESAQVTFQRYVVSEDCGVMINPMVVEGQIAGGVVQGIGGALLEEIVYDDDGNPVTSTFLDYLLPTASDVPTIEYGHIETLSGTPGGHKGMGEGGAIGAPPAVINAVYDALAPYRIELTRQPLSPGRLFDLIAAAESGAA
jgi:aerobic carbon-monoxide dehydrogenase large subunit